MVFGPSFYLNDVYVLHSNLEKTQLPLKGVELLMLRSVGVRHLDRLAYEISYLLLQKNPLNTQQKNMKDIFWIRKRGESSFYMA